ncbi:MAG: tetratricopeptide repeat protein [Candidatus Bathyarchaeota archaeon]|nr:tetratricopeptide repeat protein [Candidatus Bathyarchaeota archaeon]
MSSSEPKTHGKPINTEAQVLFEQARKLQYDAADASEFLNSKHLLESLESKLQALCKREPNDAQVTSLLAQVQYELAQWYLTEIKEWQIQPNQRKAKSYLEKAWKLAQRAIMLDKGLAEAYTIMADASMRLIPFKGWKFAAIHGRKAKQAILNSMRLDAKNSRALLSLGLWYFFTPSEFGGSHDRALQLFEKVVKLAITNHERFLAHIWLGQALLRKQDKSRARAEFEQALLIYPHNVLAKALINATK